MRGCLAGFSQRFLRGRGLPAEWKDDLESRSHATISGERHRKVWKDLCGNVHSLLSCRGRKGLAMWRSIWLWWPNEEPTQTQLHAAAAGLRSLNAGRRVPSVPESGRNSTQRTDRQFRSLLSRPGACDELRPDPRRVECCTVERQLSLRGLSKPGVNWNAELIAYLRRFPGVRPHPLHMTFGLSQHNHVLVARHPHHFRANF
jgi:hypothetical protein